MTIRNEIELKQVLDRITTFREAIRSINAEYGAAHPSKLAVLIEGPLSELRALQAEVDAYYGVVQAEELQAPLWLRVTGKELENGIPTVTTLTTVLDSVRKAVLAITECLQLGHRARRPTQDLLRATDLRAIAFKAGSLRVGLDLPRDAQMHLFNVPSSSSVAEIGLRKFLDVVAWADITSNTSTDLENIVEDRELRRVALQALDQITPSGRGMVDTVEFSGRIVPAPRPLILERRSREKIGRAFEHLAQTHTRTFAGILREIDLDRNSFILRNVDEGSEEPTCRFGDEFWETARDALDRKVLVTVERRQVGTGRNRHFDNTVIRIEFASSDDDED